MTRKTVVLERKRKTAIGASERKKKRNVWIVKNAGGRLVAQLDKPEDADSERWMKVDPATSLSDIQMLMDAASKINPATSLRDIRMVITIVANIIRAER